MKKVLLGILIGGIVFGTIGATAAYVYTARDIGYIPSDENWNVTNASEALTSLKDDLNTVNTNVSEYKQQITEALADKGVSVDENSSMSDITSGISNMTKASDSSFSYSIQTAQGVDVPMNIQTSNNCITAIDITSPGNSVIKNLTFNTNDSKKLSIAYFHGNSGTLTVPTSVSFADYKSDMIEDSVSQSFSVTSSYGTINITSSLSEVYGIKSISFTKSQSAWTMIKSIKLDGNKLIINHGHPYSSAESVTANVVFVGK